jgi:hypothetical protein
MPLRLMGLHELLCNKCGLEFKGLDPFGRLERKPVYEIEATGTRRRVPRYPAHLPTTIHLAEQNLDTGTLAYSDPSWGHCESISKFGLTLSLVGTKFAEEELARTGRLLFVTIDLPNGPIDAIVSIVTHDRTGSEKAKGKWVIGASISSISENDSARLATYLDKRAEGGPVITLD